jgi:hypothetical protein
MADTKMEKTEIFESAKFFFCYTKDQKEKWQIIKWPKQNFYARNIFLRERVGQIINN